MSVLKECSKLAEKNCASFINGGSTSEAVITRNKEIKRVRQKIYFTLFT